MNDAIYILIVLTLLVLVIKSRVGKRRMLPPSEIAPQQKGSLFGRIGNANGWLQRYDR